MYTVGQISRICNTSIKTLHYYDKIGLLKPAYIDESTNYRYYDYYHIKQLKLIKQLKSYEIPLKDIQNIIEDNNMFMIKRILGKKIEDIKKNITRQQELISNIENQIKCIDEKDIMMSTAEVSDVIEEVTEKILICGIRQKTSLGEIDILVKKLFQKLYSYNLDAIGNLMTIYYDEEVNPDDCDIEVCIPVNKNLDNVLTHYLHGGKCLSVIVNGPYSELSYGYEKIINWINKYNYEINGYPFEIYIDGLTSSKTSYVDIRPDLSKNPAEFKTKICIPVK